MNQSASTEAPATADQAVSDVAKANSADAKFDRLEMRLAAQDARILELEKRLAETSGAGLPAGAAPVASAEDNAAALKAASAPAAVEPVPVAVQPGPMDHEHSMNLPGGPKLKISGFADLNLGFGSDANALIFPLVPIGTTAHNTFQIGEFDLFLASKLAQNINFVSEVVSRPQ